MALGISAVLSTFLCASGCMQPAFLGPQDSHSAFAADCPAHSDAHATEDTEDCPLSGHHRSSPEPPQHHRHNDGVSCCPLQGAILQKSDVRPPEISLALLAASAAVVANSAHPFAEPKSSSPVLWQSGRDILLAARLLRI